MQDMIRYGLQGLAALGLEMPENPDDDMIAQAMDEVKQALKGRSVRDLLQNPPATDERAQVWILNHCWQYVSSYLIDSGTRLCKSSSARWA